MWLSSSSRSSPMAFVILCVLLTACGPALVLGQGQSLLADLFGVGGGRRSPYRPPARSPFPLTGSCRCSDFMWLREDRDVIVSSPILASGLTFSPQVGQCKSVDLDGLAMCYLHQPNSCLDAEDSLVFPGMQVSKLGCGCRRVGRNGFCIPPRDIFGRQGQNAAKADDDDQNDEDED